MASVWQSTSRRFLVRFVIGLLAVSLPVTTLVVILVTNKAEQNLEQVSRARLEGRATSTVDRFERWLAERKGDLAGLAAVIPPTMKPAEAKQLVKVAVPAFPEFGAMAVLDAGGQVIAASDPASMAGVSAEPWVREALAGKASISPLEPPPGGGAVHWFVAQPVLGPGGKTSLVVVGDMSQADLRPLLGRTDAISQAETQLVDAQKRLITSTLAVPAGQRLTARDLVARGGFRSTVNLPAVDLALAGQTGAGGAGSGGGDSFAGWAPLRSLGWAVVARANADEMLGPVGTQRRIGASMLALAAVLMAGFAIVFGRREAAKLLSENQATGARVNANATELSSASEELAATTTEQTAAVTESSATLEELARTSASIAETVDRVAVQALDTAENLGEAEQDIRQTSQRTAALAKRVDEIGGILELINEIADQTNLLALNAAIEAARAGEDGRGFAVVADEVRRLAERSKTSAADIATIVEGIQAETNATVMAMEKGSRQMQQSLHLLEQVTEAAEQVRLTTQQQRVATEQAVETMEQLTGASRQVSATARQIAASAVSLATVASRLEGSRLAHEVGASGGSGPADGHRPFGGEDPRRPDALVGQAGRRD